MDRRDLSGGISLARSLSIPGFSSEKTSFLPMKPGPFLKEKGCDIS
jgi:hypothetical protein